MDLEKLGIKIRDDEDRYVGAVHRDDKSKLLFPMTLQLKRLSSSGEQASMEAKARHKMGTLQ